MMSKTHEGMPTHIICPHLELEFNPARGIYASSILCGSTGNDPAKNPKRFCIWNLQNRACPCHEEWSY